jgi:serine/threonine protein kinase/WD40 repeat protein
MAAAGVHPWIAAVNERSLFLAALDIDDPAARVAYLDQACDDAAMRQRVERLLCAHAAAGDFLLAPAIAAETPEGPALETVGPLPSAEGPGSRLGPYTLRDKLGEGGMGVVYLAEQEQPVRRQVALKVLKAGMDSRHVLARFEAERQALALMDHANIAKVLDAGATPQGRPYFVMELVKGQPITTYCDEHRLTPKERLELFVSVCQAIQHAHTKGIIHRDLKPSNILVAPYDGQPVVKVIDFGVAKALGQRLTDKTLLTEVGAVIGTLEYMSPEQAELNNHDIDTRSDIYCLGVVLYELLTGTTPLDRKRRQEASFVELLRVIREEEPPRPSTRLSESRDALASVSAQRQTEPARLTKLVRGELDWIVLKCLEKDRTRRYQTANGLARDIERYLADEAVEACPPSVGYRLGKFARKYRAALATALGFALLLVIGAAVSGWLAVQARRAQAEATERLFEALVTRAEAGRTSKRPGQRFGGLEALRQAAQIARDQGRPVADLVRLRSQAIACLALPDLRLDHEWEGNPPGTSGLAFDARFERYAWCFQDEGIRVRRLADHAELLRLPTPPSDQVSRGSWMRFSPDGRYLAAWYPLWGPRKPLEVWDLQAGEFRRPHVIVPDAGTKPEFAGDGRTLFVGLEDGAVARIDLATGREVGRLDPGWPPEGLALHPDGRLLAVASTSRPGVQIRDLQTGRVVRELLHPAGVQVVAWQPQGSLLATGCNDHLVRLWDAASGQLRATLEGHRWEVHDLAFDPSGGWLLSFGWDMALCAWDVGFRRQVLKLEDVRVLGFGTHQGMVKAAGLTGRRVGVWSFHPSDVHHVLHGLLKEVAQKELHSHQLSPDDRWLTTSVGEGNLRLWDVATRALAAELPELGAGLWGPRGEWLLTPASDRLLRFPVRPLGPGGSQGIRIGPPREVPNLGIGLVNRKVGFAWSGPGCRRLFVADGEHSRVHLLEIGEACREKWRAPMPRSGYAAGSPDGRWVAAGSAEGGSGVRVWEADTGRLEKELPIGDAYVQFSPDSRWLYTITGRLSPRGAELCAWRVGTWEPAHRLALIRTTSSPTGPLGVALDGTAVAVPYSQETVRLVRADSFAEVATLAAPDPGLLVSTTISHDGALLLATAGHRLHFWDLRRLRQELKPLRLDWDLPDYPPGPAPSPRPLRVVVDKGE